MSSVIKQPIKSNRRRFLGKTSLGCIALATGSLSVQSIAQAATSLAPTQTMRGGSNNYAPGAPIVDNLGTGFRMHGSVLRAGDGQPLANVRIQIWAATERGGEREPSNHGSVLTKEDGSYELEMSQILPNFGEPHAHLAYDDDEFGTVFLRPVMGSVEDTSLQADFVLAPA